MPRIHHLKSWPEPFAALKSGTKTFEIRKDDRGFMVGDVLCLEEWEPHNIRGGDSSMDGGFEVGSPDLWYKVTYKAPGGSWGLPVDLCVLGVEPCPPPEEV